MFILTLTCGVALKLRESKIRTIILQQGSVRNELELTNHIQDKRSQTSKTANKT